MEELNTARITLIEAHLFALSAKAKKDRAYHGRVTRYLRRQLATLNSDPACALHADALRQLMRRSRRP